MPLTTDTSSTILQWILGHAVVPYTAPFMLRLMTVNGDDDTLGTEVAGDEYEDQEIDFPTPDGKTVTASAEILFASLDSVNSTHVVGVEVWDSGLEPRRIGYFALTAAVDVPASTPYSIPLGDFIFGLQ